MFCQCGRAGTWSFFPSPQYLNAISREIRVFLKLPGTDGVAGLHALPRSILCLIGHSCHFPFAPKHETNGAQR